MPNIDIFKTIAADPHSFEIEGADADIKSEAGTSQLVQKLGTFAEEMDNLIEQYRAEITQVYYEDPDFGNDDIWDDDFPIHNSEAHELEFAGFRTQFMDALKEAAILLDMDEGDITSAFGFDYNQIEDEFFIMADEEHFTDEDALKVLEGILLETNYQIDQLNGESNKKVPPISAYIAKHDDGTMYDDPKGP